MRPHFRFSSFWKDVRAVASIEFAFILPVLLLLTLPLYDFYNFILIRQKVNKTASTLADMISISIPEQPGATDITTNQLYLKQSSLNPILNATPSLMLPYPFNNTANAKVTALGIYKDTAKGHTGVYMEWLVNYTGGTPAPATNYYPLGAPIPATITMPPNFVNSMYDNESTVIVQVQYQYNPLLPYISNLGIPVIAAQLVQATRFFPARSGPLISVDLVN